jgi:hypothetical protein
VESLVRKSRTDAELKDVLAGMRRRMRAANADYDSLAADLAEALRLLRELREAVKAEKVLRSRKYVGLALAISHLLDRFPIETEVK